jgi:hypothetical protein
MFIPSSAICVTICPGVVGLVTPPAVGTASVKIVTVLTLPDGIKVAIAWLLILAAAALTLALNLIVIVSPISSQYRHCNYYQLSSLQSGKQWTRS